MTKYFLISVILLTSVAFSQSDSTSTPSQFRFNPAIRNIAGEASTLVLFLGSFGATFDFDFFEVPSETIPGIGVRFTYQEFHRGFFRSGDQSDRPIGYLRGAFLRGTHQKGSGRSDIFLGVGSTDSYGSHPSAQLLFGVDLRLVIFKPLSNLFMRIMGNSSGAAVLFGISLGYTN